MSVITTDTKRSTLTDDKSYMTQSNALITLPCGRIVSSKFVST